MKENSYDVANSAINCAADLWGYVYGANGELYTKSLAEKWKADPTRGVPSSKWDKSTYYTEDCSRWFGHYVCDCSGLITYVCRKILGKDYPDRTANGIKEHFQKSGQIKDIPEIAGLAVWKSGHIGIYIGGGLVVEAKGTYYGVIVSKLSDTKWEKYGYIEGITYPKECTVKLPVLRKGADGCAVRTLQALLQEFFTTNIDVDGDFGNRTEATVKRFQSSRNLDIDGIVGAKTWKELILNG